MTKEEGYKIVAQSIKEFPLQLASGYNSAESVSLPDKFMKIEKIVACGMGGSGLPIEVVSSCFDVKFPLQIINDYHIPSWADDQTLVIVASYSGNTEEVISCAKQAIKSKCQAVAIASGGKLETLFRKKGLPAIIFGTSFNPSGQPRLGTGYTIGAEFGLLRRLGLVNFEGEFRGIVDELSSKVGLEISAQTLARKLKNKINFIISSHHLRGSAHVFANQLNETSKVTSFPYYLPELNHHLLEGLKYPENKEVQGVFLFSDKYSQKIKKRMRITKDVFEKNNANTVVVEITGKSKFSEGLSSIVLSSWTSLALAQEYKVDPTAIPWVDYFKEKLG